MSEFVKMIEAHFKVETLGRSKAEVASEYGVSPRTLGRWIDKVVAARDEFKTKSELKRLVHVNDRHEQLEGTVSRRRVWTYINPNPTKNADARASREAGGKKNSPWPSVHKNQGLSKKGEGRLKSLADKFPRH